MTLDSLLQKRRIASFSSSKDDSDFTLEHRLMYHAEKLHNFRTIYRLLGTKSHYRLSSNDLASPETWELIRTGGQFADVASKPVSPGFIWSHLEELSKEGYPLDARVYDALQGCRLLDSWFGSVADLYASLVLRPATSSSPQQFVVAFSGTCSVEQALRDFDARRHTYKIVHNGKKIKPSRGMFVHAGFWGMYKGHRERVHDALRKAVQSHPDVENVLVVGHSLGGAMAHLFVLDLLQKTKGAILKPAMKITVLTLGAPRAGSRALAKYWRTLVSEYKKENGDDSFAEVCVKAYNDGCVNLPPAFLGYQHFSAAGHYHLNRGKLYAIPDSESEHALFDIAEGPSVQNDDVIAYPRGGHNYYGRDMEKLVRSMSWIDLENMGETEWEKRFLDRKRRWSKKHESRFGSVS